MKTVLYDFHVKYDATMVEFGGYEMPLHYGSMSNEHKSVRSAAGVFDVSHMGQAIIYGAKFKELAIAIEKLVPSLIRTLKPGMMKYTVLLNEEGGIIDDLIVTRFLDNEDSIGLVLNAFHKKEVLEVISKALKGIATARMLTDVSLIAIQGPKSESLLSQVVQSNLPSKFMSSARIIYKEKSCIVSRCGYTGEDGFEVSIDNAMVQYFTEELVKKGAVMCGLAARDILRLEAAMCLSGQDIDTNVNPYEADLGFVVSKKRLMTSKAAWVDKLYLASKSVTKKRYGILFDGRIAARQGAEVFAENGNDNSLGVVTSGSFSLSLKQPIAMALLDVARVKEVCDTKSRFFCQIRGKKIFGKVVEMPFVEHGIKR